MLIISLKAHGTTHLGMAGLEEEVFLHPRSCLASVAPEYVVYGDIVQTAKRPYMAMVTSVEPHWLADSGTVLCTGGSRGGRSRQQGQADTL